MATYKKAACFTDIHWGKSGNSEVHNKDCLDYIKWFRQQVEADPDVDCIIFLGDWFDHRQSINVSTLNYSNQGAFELNEIGLPIYFIIGNHDLYHRNTRSVFSPIVFDSLSNFILVSEPTVFPELGKDGSFICPYLFHHEYADLQQYIDIPVWFGHFEFKDFIVTGYNMKMQHGPDHTLLKNGPKKIFSGHYHKRQIKDNVVYIGNCFPHNFADVDDYKRGMMFYTFDTDNMDFVDWQNCPKYQRIKLSDLLTETVKIWENSRIKCICDTQITYEESIEIKQAVLETYNLRDFVLEEIDEVSELLTAVSTSELSDDDETIDQMILTMLNDLSTETTSIDKAELIRLYQDVIKNATAASDKDMSDEEDSDEGT